MHKNGQTVIEHMVVFQVFLVAGVILITALGILPKIGLGSILKASDEVVSIGPVGLLSHAIDEKGHFRIKLRNNNPGPITITDVYLEDDLIIYGSVTLGSGESRVFEGVTAYREKKGTRYSFSMTMSYRDEESGGQVSLAFSDEIAGEYSTQLDIGRESLLRQNPLSHIVLVKSDSGKEEIKNVIGDDLELFNGVEWAENNYYQTLMFDGADDYGNIGKLTSSEISELTIQTAVKTNFGWDEGPDEKGIIYKPNAFSVTALKDHKIRFNIVDNGVPDYIETSNLDDNKWYIITTTFDGEKMKIFVDGQMNNGKNHNGKIDASNYDTYVADFTPETNKNLNVTIGHITIFEKVFPQSTTLERSRILSQKYSNQIEP